MNEIQTSNMIKQAATNTDVRKQKIYDSVRNFIWTFAWIYTEIGIIKEIDSWVIFHTLLIFPLQPRPQSFVCFTLSCYGIFIICKAILFSSLFCSLLLSLQCLFRVPYSFTVCKTILLCSCHHNECLVFHIHSCSCLFCTCHHNVYLRIY